MTELGLVYREGGRDDLAEDTSIGCRPPADPMTWYTGTQSVTFE
jgi:hypothetical protein